MRAFLILLLARTSRCAIAAGDTRKAEPIVAASNPKMVCNIRGARISGAIAGCAQANISARRSSGIPFPLAAADSISAAINWR